MELFNQLITLTTSSEADSIYKVTEATNSEWDQIADSCEYSTYFHTREWSELWSKYNGDRKAKALIFRFKDGSQALLPFTERKIYNEYITSRKSSEENTFGGWISDRSLDIEYHQAIWKYLQRRFFVDFSKISITQNPYDPTLGLANIPWQNQDFTQTLDLTEGFNALYNRFNKGHKSSIKKAVREGITIELASKYSDWEEYYLAYKDSINRWDTKQLTWWEYKPLLFEILHQMKSPKLKLWVAKYKGKIISGALCFYHSKHVVYWHGSSLREYFDLRANNLLHSTIIEDACRASYNWYDFNPSGGFEGVIRFKDGFGCERKPYGEISSVHKLKNAYSSLRNQSVSILNGLRQLQQFSFNKRTMTPRFKPNMFQTTLSNEHQNEDVKQETLSKTR
jgi:hypothetical protein